MIRDLIPLIFRFLGLVAVQVVLLNNMLVSGYVNPYLYVLFILVLPVRFPKNGVLALAFLLGLSIDLFTNTAGMHAAATVFLAYIRPAVLRFYSPRDGYDAEAVPDIRHFGLQWFLVYASTMVVIHHLVLFYLEVFRFGEFMSTLVRVLLSSALTLVLILITQYLFTKNRLAR